MTTEQSKQPVRCLVGEAINHRNLDVLNEVAECSGTHEHDWLGYPATGKRFEGIDEIYILRVGDGKLVGATAVEDNLARLQQLGPFGKRSTEQGE